MCNGDINELLNSEEFTNLQNSEVLDACLVEGLQDNAMLRVRPDLWCEWDFEKNDELGLDIWKMTKGVGKAVWWICPNCPISYDMRLVDKTHGSGCPYCSGKRISYFNNLNVLYPEVSKTWCKEKNGEITPENIASFSNKSYWWMCERHPNHSWKASPNARVNGNGCPYCAKFNPKLLVGFNDMWTTAPELAKMLADPEDGYRYTQGSNKKVDWKCSDCGEIIKNKVISNVKKRGTSCPKCSDGVRYPERHMGALLDYMEVEYIHDSTFRWSNGKRYDFYIPSLNLIIEAHGGQHFYKGFETFEGATTLQETQLNDEYKHGLAINNGIHEYIVIDCRKSEFEYIKNNILNSRLAELFDLSNIDWDKINKLAESSKVLKAIDMYKNNFSVKEISYHLRLDVSTIREYLRKGNDNGWCIYIKKNRRQNTSVNF